MSCPEYLRFLEQSFNEHADKETAVQMKKYMKDKFEYYGIKSPLRKELLREQKSRFGLIPADERKTIIQWCWNAPEREWQYFAMEFFGKEAKNLDVRSIDLIEYMVITKSWWDTVDFVASNLAGPYFQKYPERIMEVTGRWMASGNMWLQRTCLLFQLKYRQNTDIDLLKSFILPLKDSNEFFIRKAIGWSLREYSKTDPEYVKDFVASYELAGLSHREALKWMQNKGLIS